jgi:hypothetical protein
LALIDSRTLVCNALAQLLQSSKLVGETIGTFVVVPFADIAEFEARCPEPAKHFDLMALNIGAASFCDDRIRADLCSSTRRISRWC